MKTSCVESVNTCSSSILRSLQSCNSDDGSESGGAAVLWLLMLLDVPGNLTATYAPSTLSTYGINKSNKLLNWDAVKEKQESKKKKSKFDLLCIQIFASDALTFPTGTFLTSSTKTTSLRGHCSSLTFSSSLGAGVERLRSTSGTAHLILVVLSLYIIYIKVL